MTRLALILALVSCASWSWGADEVIDLAVNVENGSGDPIMVVAWIEKKDGTFLRTVMMWSKDRKHYKELSTWAKRNKKAGGGAPSDAIVSPTLRWSGSGKVSIPASQDGVDLLSGDYVLHIEHAQDGGSHIKDTTIALARGMKPVALGDTGHLASITLSATGAALPSDPATAASTP